MFDQIKKILAFELIDVKIITHIIYLIFIFRSYTENFALHLFPKLRDYLLIFVDLRIKKQIVIIDMKNNFLAFKLRHYKYIEANFLLNLSKLSIKTAVIIIQPNITLSTIIKNGSKNLYNLLSANTK